MPREPFTLRKLLAKLPPDELEKFMDVPLQVQVRFAGGNEEFLDIVDDWPNRIVADPEHQQPGRFAVRSYAPFSSRKPAQ